MTVLADLSLFGAGTLLMAYFFAKLEINIEGAGGWAANLPTWRVEKHWALDLFMGGRAMTGYHCWALLLVAAVFHYPFLFTATWSLAGQAKAIAGLILFWVWEDFLWFVFNPAFGLRRFRPQHVPWHKRWVAGLPLEYWLGSALASVLLWWSTKTSHASCFA